MSTWTNNGLKTVHFISLAYLSLTSPIKFKACKHRKENDKNKQPKEFIRNRNHPIILVILQAVVKKVHYWGFPGGAVVGNLPANAGDAGSSPGLGGSHRPRSNWAREPQLLSLHV